MVKKSMLFTFIFFLTFINNAFAHTGLESSSPQDGEIVKEDIQEITFSFETKIEQGSTFQIKNSNGKSMPIDNISLNNNKMFGSLQNPLESGSYKVEWNIIGTDGHPIGGEYSFSVQIPNKQTQIEQGQKQAAEQPKRDKNEKVNEASKKYEQKKLPSYVIPSVIVVLIIIVIGSFLLLMRRKK